MAVPPRVPSMVEPDAFDLLGKKPPAFDIPFWNVDTTRMTAELHHDFLQLGVANALVHPGAATMLGSPVDLAAVDRATRRPGSSWPARARMTPRRGCVMRRLAMGRGGRTTRTGWGSAAGRQYRLRKAEESLGRPRSPPAAR